MREYPIITNFNHPKYGTLELSIVSDFMPVRTIDSRDIPDMYKFDMETAEKIALITENRRIQLSCGYTTDKRWYVVVHNSQRTAAIAAIKNINYTGALTPCDAIESERVREYMYW